MTAVWVATALLCLGTIGIKAAGPLLMGEHEPRGRWLAVIALLSPALLSSLIVYQTFSGHPDGLVVDARVAGAATAVAGALTRLPMFAVMVLAAGVTAAVRAIG